VEVFESVLPGGRPRYLQSRQARDALPLALEFFTSVQNWTVITSLVVIGVFLPRMWRLRPSRLVGLGVVIVSTVVANALVTGALSMVEDRFQSRVIWLVPLLAGVLVLDWRDHWPSPFPRQSLRRVS
jgi:drug/metabolite transporter (DMT)-like permease